jgi:hypothetical protein
MFYEDCCFIAAEDMDVFCADCEAKLDQVHVFDRDVYYCEKCVNPHIEKAEHDAELCAKARCKVMPHPHEFDSFYGWRAACEDDYVDRCHTNPVNCSDDCSIYDCTNYEELVEDMNLDHDDYNIIDVVYYDAILRRCEELLDDTKLLAERREVAEAGYGNCVLFRKDSGYDRQYFTIDGAWTVNSHEAARCLDKDEAKELAKKHGVDPSTYDSLTFITPEDFQRWLEDPHADDHIEERDVYGSLFRYTEPLS